MRSDTVNLPPSAPPGGYSPPPNSGALGLQPWVIAVSTILGLLGLIAIVGGFYWFFRKRQKRLAQTTVMPDVGERVVVAPPPMPDATAATQPARGFADRVPMEPPAEG